MAQEQEKGPVPLRSIHIDLSERSIIFEADDATATRLTFSPTGMLYELLGETAILTDAANKLRAWGAKAQQDQATPEQVQQEVRVPTSQEVQKLQQAGFAKETAPTTVLPGKLQSKPKEGREDRHGKPTAWAQLLAHVEGRDGATLLSTSFHGRTREIALQLDAGDHITAQGYLHLRRADDPEGRLSTFSVIHLINYPGKPTQGQSS